MWLTQFGTWLSDIMGSYVINSIYEGKFSFVDAKLAILFDWVFERSCRSLGFTGFFLSFDSWSLSIVDAESVSC